MYAYNLFGWLTGVAQEGDARVTDVVPPSLSVSEVQGSPRANFTGHEWAMLPYVAHDEPDMTQPMRAERWERIKAERDRRKDTGGYMVGGKWFHSDDSSRIQQLALYVMGASVPAVRWKTMDGSFVTMTQALAAQVFAAAAASDQALFEHAEALRAAVNGASDPASVDISAGWPPVFGEVA